MKFFLSRKKKVYYFLNKLVRITSEFENKPILIGSSVLFFNEKILNPTDVDIVFPDKDTFSRFIKKFKELEKNSKNVFYNESKNLLIQDYAYTIKYYGLHIDAYLEKIYTIDYKLLDKFSNRTKITPELFIKTPSPELLFVLKSLKNIYKDNYSRKDGDRNLIKNLKQLILLYHKSDKKILNNILYFVEWEVREKVIETINLLLSRERKDIDEFRKKILALHERKPKRSSFLNSFMNKK